MKVNLFSSDYIELLIFLPKKPRKSEIIYNTGKEITRP